MPGIKLLQALGDRPAGSLFATDDVYASRLVADGKATRDTTGAFKWPLARDCSVLGPYPDVATLEAAYPAAQNQHCVGLVGSAAPYAFHTPGGGAWRSADSLVSGDGIATAGAPLTTRPSGTAAASLVAPMIVTGPPPAWDENGSYFGIASSDTADKTTAFQKACDDAAGAGCDLRLGYGTYNVDGTIQASTGLLASSPSGSANGYRTAFGISGRGRGATRIVQRAGGATLLKVLAASPAVQWWDFVIRSLDLIGSDITSTASCGIQLGGETAGVENIVSGFTMEHVRMSGFYSHLRMDDVTITLLKRVFMDNYRYGIETNYNIDILTALACEFGDQATPVDVACSSTNGSPVLTGISASTTPRIRVGMVCTSSGLPDGARVIAVDTGANTVTLDQNATATGARVVDFSQGIAFAYGSGPWVPAVNSVNASRGQNDCHGIIGSWFMRQELSAEIKSVSAKNIEFCNSYFERGNGVFRIGDPANTTSAPQVSVRNCKLSQMSQKVAPINIVSGNGAPTRVTVQGLAGDSASVEWGAVPVLKSSNLSGLRLDWNNNPIVSANPSTTKQLVLGSRAIDLGSSANSARSYSCGLGRQPNYTEAVTYSATITPSCTEGNSDGFSVTLTGSPTIGPATTTNLWRGYRISFYFTQDATGGRSLTWGAVYKGATLTGAGTASQKASVVMEYDGANWVQISSTGWY